MSDKGVQNCAYLFDREEKLVQLFKAHKEFPFNVSPGTVQRWFRIGISTPHGRFKLETAVCGNKRFTSREAISRFLRIQQGQNAEGKQPVVSPVRGSMSKRELSKEMQKVGLRPRKDSKPNDPKSEG